MINPLHYISFLRYKIFGAKKQVIHTSESDLDMDSVSEYLEIISRDIDSINEYLVDERTWSDLNMDEIIKEADMLVQQDL